MALVSLNPLAELYFHGRITREDAEELLRVGPNGTFLLRSREVVNAGLDIFIISVHFESQILHYSIDRRPDGSYNIPGGKQFVGPVEIVRHHMSNQDGIKTLLIQPVTRPPELGAVVYWGLTTDIVESELFQSGGLSKEAAKEEVLKIFANLPSARPTKFKEFLRPMQYSRNWFHGVAEREEAEQRLAACGLRSGTFLIRRKKECFVLSVIHDRQFKHYLIREKSGHSSTSSPIANGSAGSGSTSGYGMDGGPLYSSLIELVHWYHAYSDGLPCALMYPCSNNPSSGDDNNAQKEKQKAVGVNVEQPSGTSSSNQNTADDELAKKLEAIALEINVNNNKNEQKSSQDGKIVVSVQRPAVAAVRPTPVIPMCKPASTPMPPDPPTLKEMMLQKQKEQQQQDEPTVKKSGGKRVIRLPKALTKKTGLENSNRPSSPMKCQPKDQSKNGDTKTTSIFDTVQTFATTPNSYKDLKDVAKDDWDEPGNGVQLESSSTNRNNIYRHNGSNVTGKKPKERQVSPVRQEFRSLQESVTYLDSDWLEIHQTIGHGHFGTVLFGYLITPQNRIPVAIKSVRESESSCVENLEKEARTMSNLTHPHIITFFGVCVIETVLLVMEYAPLGTLQKFVRSNPNFPVIRIVKLMIQVADAMRYLEKNKLVHRDLACRNVLLLSEDQAKVTDFGMSRALDVQRDYYKSQNVGKWPLKWYPPEAIYYWKFDCKTDVWSYGVTLWEATSYGARPYQGMDGWQVLKFIESGKRLDKPPACPPQLYCLMNECWKFKSSERPTFEEVLVTMLDIDCQLAANVASGD